ncbi:PREDICTED: peroxiredoxin-like [Trachymyrmex cornetzi]|uniref:thioredoxin-dependent peroxiredoxin n=1 Tax=Trachymyrmex cornetzi TaxID=471704 RepID=A0A195DJ81_9HYME|nr:PREDICTED: peroxiredoxin-like [Trachymyrmex cornetzi]KYN12877.1 Thioredoxin-dependent peroxide reductase, mitochondrial [Trachymyrmex cornetzi]
MFRLLASLRTQSGTLIATAISPLVRTDNTLLTKGVRNLTVSSKLFSDRPQIQKPAPDFSGTAVVKGDFKEIKLSDYKGKYVVLFFYPLDFTFVCPTEIIAFSEKISEFEALNTQVIGVSTDSHFSHLAWINTPRKQGGLGGDLGYPLLSDFNKTVSTNYNVLLQDSGIALRGLFIIDKEGVLRQFCVNDLPVGRSVEETLRLIKAFQFVEKHGEVCPANWQPDSKTIKPNPKDSKQYFESVN